MLRKNVAGQFVHIQGVDASTGGIKSGVTWTMRRCLDGTFAAGGATITEDSTNGWYKVALTQGDTNGNDIGYNFTGSGAIPVTINVVATAADPSDGVRFGLTALPNAAAEAAGGLYTRGSGAGQIAQQANGQADVNLSTVKTQAVTCAAAVTVGAFVGNAGALLSVDASGRIDVIKVAGTTQTARDLGAQLDAAISTRMASFTLPTNFSALAITAGGAVTAGTVSDKTGYSLANGSIAAATFAANAIDAAALASNAVDEIWAKTVTELAAVPGASAAVLDAICFLYMALRNLRTTTASLNKVYDNSGAVIGTASVSDDGTTNSKGKYA